MFFSIVIPIYKVEKYLRICIDSVLAQTFTDFELLLVDDGSPDASPMICDTYAEQDSRVQVIHKQNGGLSDARNAGLDIAIGRYIIFMDSDDWWDDSSALETIHQIIVAHTVEPDVVTWRFKKYFESSLQTEKVGYSLADLDNWSWAQLLKSRNFTVSACSKAIKKELFDVYALRFEKGVYSEDIEWCARLLSVAHYIQPSGLDFYVYRMRNGSITHTIGKKNVQDVKMHLMAIETLAEKASSEKRDILETLLAEEFCNFVVTVSGYNFRKDEYSWIKTRKYMIKKASSKRARILKCMLSMLGVRLTLGLIRLVRG